MLLLMISCTLVKYSMLLCCSYFACRFDSSDDEEVDNAPGQQEAERHTCVNTDIWLIDG